MASRRALPSRRVCYPGSMSFSPGAAPLPYRTVSFASAEAIEWEYDEEGEPVTPGGKELTGKIAASLAAAGCRVSEVEQHEHYGWGFAVRLGNDSFCQVLNPVDREVYLTIEMEWFRMKRLLLRRPRLAFERYCRLVDATLASLPGISEVRWRDRER